MADIKHSVLAPFLQESVKCFLDLFAWGEWKGQKKFWRPEEKSEKTPFSIIVEGEPKFLFPKNTNL